MTPTAPMAYVYLSRPAYITKIPDSLRVTAVNGIGGVRELHEGSPLRYTDTIFVHFVYPGDMVDMKVEFSGGKKKRPPTAEAVRGQVTRMRVG